MSPRGEFPQFAFHRPMAASSTGLAQREPALGNQEVNPPTLPVANIDMICADHHNSLPDPPSDAAEIAMIRNLYEHDLEDV